MEDKVESYCSTFFLALANPLRIRILQQLTNNPMSVNELSVNVNAERTLVSHNLALLRKAELVELKKEGKKSIYNINERIVPQIFLFLEGIVCSNCSISRTCKTLKEITELEKPSLNRPACIACR